MSRFTLVIVAVGVLVVGISASAFADVDIPSAVVYEGLTMDATGHPIQGPHDLVLRYLDTEGKSELLVESHDQIYFTDGRFKIKLGTGTPESGTLRSLKQVFAQNTEVLMEISIDSQVQNPWVRILPAGHSAATAAALSGPVGTDNKKLHWKGFESKSTLTAIQAVVLGPADNNGAGPVPIDSSRYTHPLLSETIFLGESNPVSELPAIDGTARPEVEAEEVNRPRHEDLFDKSGRRFGTTTEKVQDPARSTAAPVGVSPPADLNFAGIGNVNGVLPPDPEGTVGPDHYIQVVNLSFAIYDKSGGLLQGPMNTNTLWAGFGGPCQTDNSGDAIFLYDEPADRFVLTQFAVGSGQAVCFAISTTPDPLGTYYLYQVNTQRFPDYFKLGVWPDPQNNAYFMSTNSGFQGQYDVYAMDRENMLLGNTARPAQFFQNFVNLFMPADLDGAMLPASGPEGMGSPGILYTFRDGGEPYFGSPPTDSLDIWEFDVDWATPGNSTFSMVQSFIPPDFAEFNWTVCGFFTQNCLPQPDTAQGIDSASWWPMQRLVYRNFGTHEALVGTWTVDVNGTPDLAAPRWFELQRGGGMEPEGAGWSIHQQGTYSPDTDHRFMPSIAMDGDGNIAIGYSVTSETVYPSIRYAVRAAGDPLGTLRPEAELIAGTGSQTHSAARWGDYSSMEVDPADNCTFWYTTEYLETTGSAPWVTRVGTFQVPGCGGLSASPVSQSVCTSAGTASYDLTLLDQFTGTTNMTDNGTCPTGAVCSFSVNPVIHPDTMTTYQVGNLAAVQTTPAGEYVIGITATDNSDPSISRDINLFLNVFDMVPGSLTLDSPADGATGVDRSPTLMWSASEQGVTYDVQVATDPAFNDIVFEQALATSQSATVSPALDPVTVYYWRVRATNPCGMSSWISASFTTAQIPAILLVDDDDNAPDVLSTYTGIFDALGLDYDVWDTQNNAAPEPTALDLGPYSTVVWFSGDAFGGVTTPEAGPNATSEVELAMWLDSITLGTQSANCLLMSSQDYLWDMGGDTHDVPTAFMMNYLGVGSGDSDVTQTTVTGSGSLFGGLGPFTLAYPFSNFSDFLSPAGSGELAFSGNAGDAAVDVNGLIVGPAVYRTAYLGFPIEAIATAADREAVMSAFLDGCQVESDNALVFDDGFESGDTSAWSNTTP